MTVPAHGTEPTTHPRTGAGDYREVTAEEYARLKEQQPAPAPAGGTDPPTAAPADVDDDQEARHAAAEDFRAEVNVEQAREAREIPDGAVAVPLEGANGRDIIHILDPNDWPTSANADLRMGDYESWAAQCLAPGEYDDVWTRLDPRMRHVNDMFVEYRRLTGQDAGKSPRSMASYRRMARR